MLAEALFAGLICLVALNVSTATKTAGNSYFGLAIGLSVLVGHVCVGPISGGWFNPAVAVGPTVLRAIRGDLAGLEMLGVYCVGPLFGALVANGIFAMQTGEGLFTEEEKEKEEPATETGPGRGRLRIVDHHRRAAA
jgi:glycerol uptake facilitator-like aquaporin